MSRLTRAYKLAMSCIGALHKAHSMVFKATVDAATREELQRVAMAARRTFEQAILIDPLIAHYGPTWLQTVREMAEKDSQKFGFALENRPTSPDVKSASHQTTVREIAYLALLNYADLLIACQTPTQTATNAQVLDKCIVKPLSLIGWENTDDTRLALMALSDASDLDDSDPVLWLKLACSARSCSRRLQQTTSDKSPLEFRRLERHALERGSMVLPAHLPPNRLIARALKEIQDMPDVYPDIIAQKAETSKLTIDLPRYSWSIMGRLLMRACREGMVDVNKNILGAPLIVMTISPMLVLPPTALATICNFLDNRSIWRFEATCRGLSACIVSARTSLERREYMRSSGIINKQDIGTNVLPENELTEEILIEPPESASVHDDQAEISERSRARSSKRVQSQLITSGKRAERESKRRSVEFCVLSSVLNCTADSTLYRDMVRYPVNWTELVDIASSPIMEDIGKQAQSSKPFNSRQQAEERLGDSCLTAFIDQCSASNSGPFDVLNLFVAHVAMNVGDVFSGDASDSIILSNMFLECIDILAQRSGRRNKLDHCWYGPAISSLSSTEMKVRSLSVNLLSAELRLRRCEEDGFEVHDFDGDANTTSLLLPTLLSGVTSIIADGTSNVNIALKARCHWFAAGYYMWRSRMAHSVRESKDAESLALKQISEILVTLRLPGSSPAAKVSTPHLSSPRRSDAIWRNLSESELHRFKEEIQAAAVVSFARQNFQERVDAITAHWKTINGKPLREEDLTGLSNIGKALLERYDLSTIAVNSRFEELVDDFLTTCSHQLVAFIDDDHPTILCTNDWGGLWSLLPLGTPGISDLIDIQHPSILTIFCSCLQAESGDYSIVLMVLTRVILSSLQQQAALLTKLSQYDMRKKEPTDAELSDDDSFSDDEIFFDDLHSSNHLRNSDENKVLLFGVLIDFVMHKIIDCCKNRLDDKQRKELASSYEFRSVVHFALGFVAKWYSSSCNDRVLSQHLFMDSKLFLRIHSLIDACRGPFQPSNVSFLDKTFFVGMVRIIVTQRLALPLLLQPSKGNRMGRAVRQRACMTRAGLVASVGEEIARLLSRSSVTVVGDSVQHTALLLSMVQIESFPSDEGDKDHLSSIGTFVESLIWLWTSVVGSEVSNATGTSLERLVAEELSIPLGAMLISLCGAGLSILNGTEELTPSQLSLGEFFDSEASANDYESDEGRFETKGKRYDGILRCASQAVQCISVVCARINEKTMLSFEPRFDYGQEHGILLPLIITRVLSSLADLLLVQCSREKSRENLWAETYPFGARTTGALLDSMLHKAYRHLYGFTISSASKESSHSTDDQLSGKSVPESPDAAAQLYRCIRRTYFQSRKSPPKPALECVASSLPPALETNKIKAVRKFIFSSKRDSFLSKDVNVVVSNSMNWTSLFDDLVPNLRSHGEGAETVVGDEIMIVRRGIYRELAMGPLPSLSSGSIDSTKSQKGEESNTDERSVTAQNERALSRKFRCMLDDLSFGDTDNAEGWAGAAQCLQLKADAIADRMGYSEGFLRSRNFSVPSSREQPQKAMVLSDLLERQEYDFLRKKEGWVPFIGNDLSLFVDHSWSSFKSLNSFFQKLEANVSDPFETQILLELKGLIDKGDLVQWQQALGGMFVECLRRMSTKCLSVALFVLNTKNERTPDDEVLKSEILESLGTLHYSQLMGNQVYGYPLQVLTDHKKRDLAHTALLCFQTALEAINTTGDADDESQVTWDLHFMIGKCHEKIAKTFSLEKCVASSDTAESGIIRRAYEHHFELALNSYAASLDEARRQENETGSDVQAGGSSHGAVEVLYRLHASRLKCLLAAVQRTEGESHLVVLESLRLTECHWYDIPDADSKVDVRRRIWMVIADVVLALAQCRLEQPFFHRSVYRYAQALMWAPVFDNPATGYILGSLGTVPATKSYRIRGLNSATPCANSAEVIMVTLFEKKRPQLCAVWVTSASTSPSPFELLNNSIRKYDSIRGKYISAYIDCLRICRRTNDLETFLQWIAFCKRDLPSFYQATALTGGRLSEAHHNRDSLLLKGSFLDPFLLAVKRQTNRALVEILFKEFNSTPNKENVDLLKRSYACFLRMNCSVVDLETSREWKLGRSSIPEIETLCQIYQARNDSNAITLQSNDWSSSFSKSAVLEAALEKCRELFPMLASTIYSKNKKKMTSKSIVRSDDPTGTHTDARANEVARQFVVEVPQGLEVGEKFQTTIQVGDQLKTIRLTVPAGKPEKLKFSMKLPKNGEGDDSQKSKRLTTDDSEKRT